MSPRAPWCRERGPTSPYIVLSGRFEVSVEGDMNCPGGGGLGLGR